LGPPFTQLGGLFFCLNGGDDRQISKARNDRTASGSIELAAEEQQKQTERKAP
jgi:hypothetical protein